MEKFFIDISRWYKIHTYYDYAYKDLYAKYKIKTILFFDRKLLKNDVKIASDIEWYEVDFYDSKVDLFNKINLINKNEIFYINTFDEILVPLVHEIRLFLWFKVSREYKSFRNKHIQRYILKNSYPETTVNNIEVNIEKDIIIDYYNKLDFPYIIKPSSWVQSSGVSLIENKKDLINYVNNIKSLNENMKSRGIENDLFLIEEYIDWEMYNIVYFVDDLWNILYSPVVKVNWVKKIWINDFSNYVRINWKIVDNELSKKEIVEFIEKQVKAFWIRNTFIFQDFKKNSKWELKNIELNARIWWYRVEMMQYIYSFNLLEMILGKETLMKTNSSFAVFVFYPNRNWILKWFNNDLLDKIKSLDSYVSSRLSKYKIWYNVWVTKDWFWSIAAIRIKNIDLEKFNNDYKFLEDNYQKLIILQ